jgi:NAD(P)-dependent dehydrogenase (short-subunit alcohol dehydrogenase family)
LTTVQRKVAIVTGGSSGIGRATAVALARAEAAKVVVVARREKEGNETVQLVKKAGGDGIFVRTDVMNEDDVRALIEKSVKEYGGLDYALNNARLR